MHTSFYSNKYIRQKKVLMLKVFLLFILVFVYRNSCWKVYVMSRIIFEGACTLSCRAIKYDFVEI